MYFISRGSQVYQWAGAVHPHTRFILVAIVLMLFILTWWYGFYSITRAKVLQARATIMALQKKQADMRKASKDIISLEAKIQALQEKKDAFTLHCAQAEQELLSHILTAASASGVTIMGYTIQGYMEKGWYKTVMAQLEFEGTLDQMNTLFTTLEKSKKMIQCTYINCSLTQSHYTIMAHIRMTAPCKTI